MGTGGLGAPSRRGIGGRAGRGGPARILLRSSLGGNFGEPGEGAWALAESPGPLGLGTLRAADPFCCALGGDGGGVYAGGAGLHQTRRRDQGFGQRNSKKRPCSRGKFLGLRVHL